MTRRDEEIKMVTFGKMPSTFTRVKWRSAIYENYEEHKQNSVISVDGNKTRFYKRFFPLFLIFIVTAHQVNCT